MSDNLITGLFYAAAVVAALFVLRFMVRSKDHENPETQVDQPDAAPGAPEVRPRTGGGPGPKKP